MYPVCGRGEVNRGILCGNLKERDYFEALRVDWRIILKPICKKWDRRNGLDLSGFMTGAAA
jgi:hypothetical protein